MLLFIAGGAVVLLGVDNTGLNGLGEAFRDGISLYDTRSVVGSRVELGVGAGAVTLSSAIWNTSGGGLWLFFAGGGRCSVLTLPLCIAAESPNTVTAASAPPGLMSLLLRLELLLRLRLSAFTAAMNGLPARVAGLLSLACTCSVTMAWPQLRGTRGILPGSDEVPLPWLPPPITTDGAAGGRPPELCLC